MSTLHMMMMMMMMMLFFNSSYFLYCYVNFAYECRNISATLILFWCFCFSKVSFLCHFVITNVGHKSAYDTGQTIKNWFAILPAWFILRWVIFMARIIHLEDMTQEIHFHATPRLNYSAAATLTERRGQCCNRALSTHHFEIRFSVQQSQFVWSERNGQL